MTKSTHADVLDAPLNEIATNCDKMVACSAFPTTFTEANSTYALADVAMAGGDFTGPAAGDAADARKITVGAKSDVPIDTGGDAINVALLDTAGSRVLHVAECTSLTLVAGQNVNFPTWDIEFLQPT